MNLQVPVNQVQHMKDGFGTQGAFSVASKAKVPIVPVTLLGTGHLMPNGQEGRMYNGRVRMIVHPPIAPGSPDATMEEARRQIASALPAWAVA